MVEETARVPFSEVYQRVSDALDDAFGDMMLALNMTGELDRALDEWCSLVGVRPEQEGASEFFYRAFTEWCLFDRAMGDGSTFLGQLAEDKGGVYQEILDTQAFRPLLVGNQTEAGITLGFIEDGAVERVVDAYAPGAIKYARRWRGMKLFTRLALVGDCWVQVGWTLITDRAGLSGVVPDPVGGSALAGTVKLTFGACARTPAVL